MVEKVKRTNVKRRPMAWLSGPFFVAILAFLPGAIAAQCTQWDVSGQWNIKINDGLPKGGVAHVSFQQSGEIITGKIVFSHRLGVGTVGYGAGMRGNDFQMSAKWDNKSSTGSDVEYYVGKVGPNGVVEGVATIDGDITKEAHWSSDRAMKCVRGTDGPRPPPIRSSGKARPAQPAAAKLEPPYITASSARLPFPGAFSGIAVLTWDGGPDHPYAEVWVRVNGGEETFVVEKGKDSREISVELGKTYLYILTDGGTELAKVGVVLPPR